MAAPKKTTNSHQQSAEAHTPDVGSAGADHASNSSVRSSSPRPHYYSEQRGRGTHATDRAQDAVERRQKEEEWLRGVGAQFEGGVKDVHIATDIQIGS